jgi:hypothetical protein
MSATPSRFMLSDCLVAIRRGEVRQNSLSISYHDLLVLHFLGRRDLTFESSEILPQDCDFTCLGEVLDSIRSCWRLKE